MWLWLALTWAGTAEDVRQLEWNRAPATAFSEPLQDGDSSVRVRAAEALGRLHSSEATALLVPLLTDPDWDVRRVAAEALGQTPGADTAIRAALEGTRPVRTPADARKPAAQQRSALLSGLGRQGDSRDVATLVQALDEPWPVGGSAADGLLRLARRGQDIDEARTALVATLWRPDPRMRVAGAHALRRGGLDGADPALLTEVALAAHDLPQAAARAHLVTAVMPQLEGEALVDAFIQAASDPSPAVAVAALQGVRDATIPPGILDTWLAHDDPWLQNAAIEALGRWGDVEALRPIVQSDDPWQAALAIQASAHTFGLDWKDTTLEPVLRAAVLQADPPIAAILLNVAQTDPEPALRSAAANALVDGESADPAWAKLLLKASDPIVRESAIELLQAGKADLLVRTLVPHLMSETDPTVLGPGLVLLAETARESGLLDRDDEATLSLIRRGATSTDRSARQAATELASLLGLAIQTSGPPPAGPDGVEDWTAVSGITGAVVTTTKGTFTVVFDAATAPGAVANYARLAEEGFYDGLVWHRVVPGFVAQTGCPRGDGWGGPGYQLPDEVSTVPYRAGSVGMARGTPWDTGGSQWFISTVDTPHLVGDYTRFGTVVQGMSVVRQLERGDRIVGIEIRTSR